MQTAKNKAGEFTTRKQAAERLQVHERTVDRWIKAGELRTKMIGRSRRIYTVSLDAFIELCTD